MPVIDPFEFFIQLHLTERCNLKCKHCYQTEDRPKEMSLAEIVLLIDEVSCMLDDWRQAYAIDLSSSFTVTGGEPFLRSDLFEVLEELRKNAIDTYMLSNGTLITRELSARLAAIGVKGVQISIEGSEEVHDSIRGAGSFASSLKGIRNILDAGIELTLNTTLSELNADCFMDVIDLASSTGAQRVGFSRLVPSGSGAILLGRMLTNEAVEQIYHKIFSLHIPGLKIVTGDPVASQFRNPAGDAADPLPSGGCAAGVSGLTILPDGTITPCRRMPLPIGNVKEDSLREIWATSETLRALRDKTQYQGRCGTCSKWSACRGCRAIAYAFSQSQGEGSYLAEDPQCFLLN
ncbi:MAG: radical SAM protein [Nitrospirae bacterium]|nr:radical SAM protein [Nitrospirota bacterium]